MTLSNWNDIIGSIKWDANGLVPAVVQDIQSKEVLMLAYMNEKSLLRSIDSGVTWFWSRSRGELWNKGATSGNTQRIASMAYDCDGDTLLVRVEQQGSACHTGSYSCFYNQIAISTNGEDQETQEAEQSSDRFGIISSLESIIAERYAERPEGAYTTYLFDKGVDKILKKSARNRLKLLLLLKTRTTSNFAVKQVICSFTLWYCSVREDYHLTMFWQNLQADTASRQQIKCDKCLIS